MSIIVDQIVFKDGFTFALIASWDFDCYTHDGFFKFSGEKTNDQIINDYINGDFEDLPENEIELIF